MKIFGEKPGRQEYLVFEEVEDKSGWYRHGSIHDDLNAGLMDLNDKQARYTRVGRKFMLMQRGVSPWREFVEPWRSDKIK